MKYDARTRRICFLRTRVGGLALTGCMLLLAQAASATDQSLQLLLPPGLAESQLCHINQTGSAIGLCEIFDAAGSSIADFGCTFSKGSVTPIPNLSGYRKLQCTAISDNGLVVGHAYSPKKQGNSPLQAIVFAPLSKTTIALPQLPSTNTALASAISADGKIIGGVCSGQPCVWQQNMNVWDVSPLPLSKLGVDTQHVCLSDSGKIAVSRLRTAKDAQLLQWTYDDQGSWRAAIRLEVDVTPYDVNNTGVVVGSKVIKTREKLETRGFILFENREIDLIEPFEGDDFSTARSINNMGVVVGWSDGVGQSSKWPRSFYWQSGHTHELIIENTETASHQAFGINDKGEIAGLLERDDDPHSVGFIVGIELP